MQFENINPQTLVYDAALVPDPVEARIPLTRATFWAYQSFNDPDRTLRADEFAEATTSSLTIQLDGSDIPGSPFSLQLRPGPVSTTNARGLQHRTPLGGTTHVSTQPANAWTWQYFPDDFFNVAVQPDVLDDLVMSDWTLETDFSNEVRLA